MKNTVKLDNYYFPQELIDRIKEFAEYYNNRRYHESLQNLTPADVFFGRDKTVLQQREIRVATTELIDNYQKQYFDRSHS